MNFVVLYLFINIFFKIVKNCTKGLLMYLEWALNLALNLALNGNSLYIALNLQLSLCDFLPEFMQHSHTSV